MTEPYFSKEALSEIQSIFVLCPNWVGDMVMATPALRTLRRRFASAKITLCVKPNLVGLIDGAPWYDEIFVYDKKKRHKRLTAWIKFISTVRSKRYQVAVILPGSFRSGLIGWLSRARIRIGYERLCSSWMLTHSLKRPSSQNKFLPTYMGNYYGNLVGLLDAMPDSMELELPLSPSIIEEAKQIWNSVFPETCPYLVPKILMTPGASFGSSKLWPPEYYASIAILLGQNYRAKILICPGPGEEQIADSIYYQIAGSHPVTSLPSSRINLNLLKGLIYQSDLLISNDTGPRHIAHAFKIPAVITMGPTDPRYTETPLEKAVVLRHEIQCAPCHLKKCPYTHHGCMRGIAPTQVYEAARTFLNEKGYCCSVTHDVEQNFF